MNTPCKLQQRLSELVQQAVLCKLLLKERLDEGVGERIVEVDGSHNCRHLYRAQSQNRVLVFRVDSGKACKDRKG